MSTSFPEPPQVVGGKDWRYLVGNMTTGEVLAEPPASGCPFTVALGGSGSIGAMSIRMDNDEVRRMDLRNITRPGASFLGVAYKDVIVAAGPIWTRNYARSTRTLTLNGAGFGSIFDHRKAVGLTAASNADLVQYAVEADGSTTDTRWWTTLITTAGDTRYTGSRYEDMARGLVAASLSRPYGQLPVIYAYSDASINASRHDKLYYGYDLPWVGELLKDLSALEDGPDIAFRPRWSESKENHVEWVMAVGAPDLSQVGEPWHFDADVENTGVTDINIEEDGSKVGHVAWETGAGQDRLTIVASAANDLLMRQGWPLLEVEESRPTVDRHETLMSHAKAFLGDSKRPTDDWTVTVRADTEPHLGTYAEGDVARVAVAGDDYLPDGTYPGRITQISGGGGDSVTLTFASATGLT